MFMKIESHISSPYNLYVNKVHLSYSYLLTKELEFMESRSKHIYGFNDFKDGNHDDLS